MYAFELADCIPQDFIYFYSHQPLEQARKMLDAVDKRPAAVIVTRPDVAPYAGRYLFSTGEFMRITVEQNDSQPLAAVLQIETLQATPCLDPYDQVPEDETQYILIKNGLVAGFYDARQKINNESLAGEWPAANYLQSRFPDRLALDEKYALELWITRFPDQQGNLALGLPANETVDIIVEGDDRLAVLGDNQGQIIVPGGEENSPSLWLQVQAVQPGLGRLKVTCLHYGLPLGAISITTHIQTGALMEQPADKNQAAELAPAPNEAVPDLTLFIMEKIGPTDGELSFNLYRRSAPQEVLRSEAVRLNYNPQERFLSYLAQVEDILCGDHPVDEESALIQMELLGERLFLELFPKKLQEVMLEEREHLHTIQILSRESWVPWEMVRLVGRVDGRPVAGKFLGEYQLTRWNPDFPRQPEVRLENLAVIHTEDAACEYMQAETDFMLSLEEQYPPIQVTEIPARLSDLVKALEKGAYTGLHFAGHGLFAGQAALKASILLDGNNMLFAEQLSGRLSACGQPNPLVFLNACQTARGADLDAWAYQFLSIGAAAFIGTRWRVDDLSAYEFCSEFYRSLFECRSVGQAALNARLYFKERSNLCWLAYTVFCDPFAQVT